MTVVQYFREKYNVNLQCSQWPSLQVGSDSKPTYLPMEVCLAIDHLCSSPSVVFLFVIVQFRFFHILCFCLQVCKIVKGQRYSKKLNDQQVTAILRAACRRPAERERDVTEVSTDAVISIKVIFNC